MLNSLLPDPAGIFHFFHLISHFFAALYIWSLPSYNSYLHCVSPPVSFRGSFNFAYPLNTSVLHGSVGLLLFSLSDTLSWVIWYTLMILILTFMLVSTYCKPSILRCIFLIYSTAWLAKTYILESLMDKEILDTSFPEIVVVYIYCLEKWFITAFFTLISIQLCMINHKHCYILNLPPSWSPTLTCFQTHSMVTHHARQQLVSHCTLFTPSPHHQPHHPWNSDDFAS